MTFKIPDHIANSDLVIFDCDDVLVDYVGGLRLHAQNHFGLMLDPAGPDSWDMSGWFGREKDEVSQIVAHFNESGVGDFHRIPEREGAMDLVSDVLASGRRIEVVTSSTTNPKAMARREDNLSYLFGERAISKIHFLDIGQCKGDILSSLRPSVFIDDNPKHVSKSIECGHFGMLMKVNSNIDLHNGRGFTDEGYPYLQTMFPAVRMIQDLPVIESSAPAIA